MIDAESTEGEEAIASVWEHRCSDGVGGYTAIRSSLVEWPVVINDAPLRCGFCEKPIVGSGAGSLRMLARLLSEHTIACRGRD